MALRRPHHDHLVWLSQLKPIPLSPGSPPGLPLVIIGNHREALSEERLADKIQREPSPNRVHLRQYAACSGLDGSLQTRGRALWHDVAARCGVKGLRRDGATEHDRNGT